MIKYIYKGVEHTVQGDTTTLTTSGKYCEDNIFIEASGGITPEGTITITNDGTYDVTNYATAEVQTSIPPQMDDVDDGGVVFINYNGDVLYQYNTTNMLAASELPLLPNNYGFKEETWNWTLAEIKEHLTTYPDSTLTVGVNLVPADEKTHIFYEVKEDTKTIYVSIGLNGTATIEWGDGSSDSTITGSQVASPNYSPPHTYSTAGIYDIKISVSGSMGLVNGNNQASYIITYTDDVYANSGLINYYSSGVKKLWIGKNVVYISRSYSLSFINIQEISLPNNLVCSSYGLLLSNSVCKGLVIPKPTTTIDWITLNSNNGIKYFSLPSTFTTIDTDSIISNTTKLKYFTITGLMTTLPDVIFHEIHSMINLSIPNTITSIPNHFCTKIYSMLNIKMPSSITSMGSSIFTNANSCKKLDLSNLTGLTTIPSSSFTGLTVCEEVKLPPNLQTIGGSSITQTKLLTKIKFPTSVISIGNYAFQNSNGLLLVDFRDFTSIPSLGGTSAFAYSNSEMKIVVPDSLYSTWITTTNWTALASKIVKESEYSD